MAKKSSKSNQPSVLSYFGTTASSKKKDKKPAAENKAKEKRYWTLSDNERFESDWESDPSETVNTDEATLPKLDWERTDLEDLRIEAERMGGMIE